mgnify:FL=1
MYKVNDLVRVIDSGAYYKKGEVFVVKREWMGQMSGLHIVSKYDEIGLFHIYSSKVEPVTHLTTKEFIKEVEKLGYEAVTFPNSIGIVKGIEVLAYVSSDVKNSLDTDVEGGSVLIGDNLFKVLTIYANTPLELREEIEQLYTLELPNTTIKARYFRFGLPHAKHSYKFGALPKSTPNGDIDYQTYFTQEEIDQLHNQELIKQLKKEPVK